MERDLGNLQKRGLIRASDIPIAPEYQVVLDTRLLTITVDPGGRMEYEIDCEDFSCPSECLHLMAHLSSKVWATNQVMHDIWKRMQEVWLATHDSISPKAIDPARYRAWIESNRGGK